MGAGSLDRAGAGLSGLCLAHCLALPLLGSAAPALAGWAEAEWVHVLILGLAAPVAVRSLLLPKRGLRPRASVAALAAAGLLLLALGAFGPAELEHQASIIGGIVLGSAHILNWRRHRLGRSPCPGEVA